ncbi:MAG TPA: DUF5615 family PIN-like protein [Gemmatimonadaceae bacterium]
MLIDECLSPANVGVANEEGFEAHHVVHRGWSGHSDVALLRHAMAEDLILVTNNGDDFRKLVSGVELHPGLIVLVDNMRRSEQARLFRLALAECRALDSCINKVIEVASDGNVVVFDLPAL